MTTYQYVLDLKDKMTATLRKAGVEGSKTYDELHKKQERLNSSAGSFVGILGKLGIAFGAFELGKKIVTAGADIESTRVAFATFMGDVTKANALIAQLNDFANVTPYSNDEVIQAGRQFLAAQIPAERIRKTLEMVGNVASGAKVPLNEMAQIYSKAMNKGRVQAEELNQLAERGVPILQTFVKMGVAKTTEGVLKLGEQGKLTSKLLTKAFETMTGKGGMFENMMSKQAELVGGKWSTLLGNIDLKFQQVGEALNPIINKILTGLIKMVDGLDGVWKSIKNVYQEFQNGNPWLIAFGSILVGITVTLVAYKTWVLLSTAATWAWATAMKVLNLVMTLNPVGLIIAGIVALITAIAFVIYKTDGWGKTWENTMLYIRLSFMQMGGFLELKWLEIQNTFLTGFETIKIGWYKLEKLWNKDAANEGLASIQESRNKRAEEIMAARNKVNGLADMRKNMKVWNVTWNKDRKLSDIVSGVKNSLGMSDTTTTAGTAGTEGGTTGTTPTDLSKGISGGGARPTNINITLGNLVESITITPSTLTEGAQEMERKIQEVLLRVLNSANRIAVE